MQEAPPPTGDGDCDFVETAAAAPAVLAGHGVLVHSFSAEGLGPRQDMKTKAKASAKSSPIALTKRGGKATNDEIPLHAKITVVRECPVASPACPLSRCKCV